MRTPPKHRQNNNNLNMLLKNVFFSKIINRMQPVAQCVTCSHVWLLYPRGHLTFSGSGCCTCNMPSLPYHHYPDTNHNKQPLILLELQKNTGSTDPYQHLQNRTRTLAYFNTPLILLVKKLAFTYLFLPSLSGLWKQHQWNSDSVVSEGCFSSHNAVT